MLYVLYNTAFSIKVNTFFNNFYHFLQKLHGPRLGPEQKRHGGISCRLFLFTFPNLSCYNCSIKQNESKKIQKLEAGDRDEAGAGKQRGAGMDIVKLTLSEQVYNILKEDILAGNIQAGDRLVNRDLQERFKVSSTPVRDAINKLYQDGLIKEVTKTGAKLIDFDFADAEEINEFICFLSCKALMLSARNGDSEEVMRRLTAHQEEMEKAEDDDAYFDADFRYHKTFFDHCGNRFLKETYKRYNLIRFMLMRYAIHTMEEKTESVRQHREITEAYLLKEYDRAKKLLNDHYQHGIDLIDGVFAEQKKQN